MRISKIKKPLCAAMAAITVAASLSVVGGVSASAAATSYNAWCDVNMDGRVDTNDALTLVDYINGDNGKYFAKSSCYDYNHDGVVDANDAIKLLNYLLFPSLYKIGINIADFNDDGKINSRDASYMCSNFDKLKNNFCYDFDGNRVVDDADIDYFIYHIILPDEYPLNIVTIRYDVPLYYQSNFGLCWAYTGVMVTDYFQNGLNDGYRSYDIEPRTLHGRGFEDIDRESDDYAKRFVIAFVHPSSKKAIALYLNRAASLLSVSDSNTVIQLLSRGADRKLYESNMAAYAEYMNSLDDDLLTKIYWNRGNNVENLLPDYSKNCNINSGGDYGYAPKYENDQKVIFGINPSCNEQWTLKKLSNILSTYGPLVLYYGGNSGIQGHAVVLTGVDVANNLVYTNNSHGISGSQSFEDFMNCYIGYVGSSYMSVSAMAVDPFAKPLWEDTSNFWARVECFGAYKLSYLGNSQMIGNGLLCESYADRIISIFNSNGFWEYMLNNDDPLSYLLTPQAGLGYDLYADGMGFLKCYCDFNGNCELEIDDFYYLKYNYNDLIDMVNNADKELYSLDLPPINFDII